MNILITGVGGPTPRSFVRAVKNSENPISQSVKFIGVDCNPLAYGLYDRSLFDSSYVIPRADDEGYWASLNQIIEAEDIDAAIILPEVEVMEWAANCSELSRQIKTHLPGFDLAEVLVNKHQLHRYLEDSDWIPKFERVDPAGYDYKKIAN